MSLPIEPEEVMLPHEFLKAPKEHLNAVMKFRREKLVLLEDSVIPAVVVMRYDSLEKMLETTVPHSHVPSLDRTTLSKPESMLLTIRDRIHFFEGMSEEEIMQAVHNVDFLRLKKDDIIFEQFSHGKQIYYIVKGDVMISGYSEKGKSDDNFTGLTVLEEGHVFGELGPILDEGRSARATVHSDDALLMVMELQEEESAASAKVYRNLMRSLARKLIQTNNQLYPFICG